MNQGLDPNLIFADLVGKHQQNSDIRVDVKTSAFSSTEFSLLTNSNQFVLISFSPKSRIPLLVIGRKVTFAYDLIGDAREGVQMTDSWSDRPVDSN